MENTKKVWEDFKSKAEKKLEKLKKDRTWIEEAIFAESQEAVKKIVDEVSEKIKQTETQEKNIDPIFNKKVAYDKSQEIKEIVNKLFKIKKPKPAENPKAEEAKADAENAQKEEGAEK